MFSDGTLAEEQCGEGIDCCSACETHSEGIRSECLTFVYGEDPRSEAEEHCKNVYNNKHFCHHHHVGKLPGWQSIFLCLTWMYLEEEVIVEIRTGNGAWDATESDLTLQFRSDKVCTCHSL